MGLGSNLTLDATINPDFGQVEVDPAVVNLSDVETFFQEKRPFFIEGASIFNFGRGGSNNFWGFNWGEPIFFYTRRIGRAPEGEVPESEFTRRPEGTSILGAAKLTGMLGESWRIGMVHAVTAREYAEVQQGGVRNRVEIEPLAYYGVLRTQREFGSGRQGLGMLATLTARSFDDHRLRDQVNAGALVLGLDGWSFLDASRTWVATGWMGFSQVRGTAARITALQESSLHYFQRPDASHIEVDSSATSLSGFAARFTINKQKGNVIFNSALGLIDPGFDTNDLGFSWRTDVINAHVVSGYRWTRPGRFAREASAWGAVFGSRDFEGNTLWLGVVNGGYIQFPNYHQVEWFLAYNPASKNNRLTRGGPLTRNPPGGEAGVFWESDERHTWVFRAGVDGGRYGEDSQRYWSVQAGVEWKPASNVALRLEPRFRRYRTASQWVDAFEDTTAAATFGRRYVFADMDQTELSADTRLDWTFTPNLSLQLYAQPLFSTGDYENFKELARPGSYAFRRYGEDGSTFSPETYEVDPDGPTGPAAPFRLEDPDFNFRSLRGNMVLRWEFRPGSTLYLVWTQTRSESETIPEFRLARSASRLWDAEPDNILVVKMTYWWTP